MADSNAEWEKRNDVLWQHIDCLEPDEFVARMNDLASELPDNHPVGLFERGCAQDSTGHSDLAVPLYLAALSQGISGARRRRANIQMASSLRNLGSFQEAADILESELLQPSDELDSAVKAFLALAWFDLGREGDAVSLSLEALAAHLPRYSTSLVRYAQEITNK